VASFGKEAAERGGLGPLGREGKEDINDNLGKRIKLKEGGRVNDDLWKRKCPILLNVCPRIPYQERR
jgi:hypothetical protein